MSHYENIGIVKPTVLSYLWKVENVNISSKNNKDYLSSPVFSTMHSSTEHKWLLHLYPKGDSNSSKDCMSLFLKYMGQRKVEVTCSLSLIDDKQCKVNEHSFQRVYAKDSLLSSLPFGFTRFAEQKFVTDKTNKVLVNDINILCEIIYDSDLAVPFKNKCIKQNLPDYSRLKEFDKFEKLLQAENSTDVTIRIGKDDIKVHKAIIINRSPVFQAMFEHDMKEKYQNIVEITDIKYEVMKEVFRFMYVGKVNELEKMATDLLLAADKYSMKGLKLLCEKQLFENLAVSNAIDYLKLADMCNSNDLKSNIIKFIISNQKDIIEKPELQLLPVEVVCEVFRAVVRDNLNK